MSENAHQERDLEAPEENETLVATDESVKTEAKPEAPEFNFFRQLKDVHSLLTVLNGYGFFMVKYTFLQLLVLAGKLSFLVFAYVAKDLDFNNISPETYAIFGVIGLLNLLSQILPNVVSLLVDQLKMQLQVTQGTMVVSKLFQLEHGSVVSTPTGTFAQLLAKVYMNLDKLLPALYGTVIPMVVEVVVAVVLIGIAFGGFGLIQLGMFVIYSVLSYIAAKQKAHRNKEMMMVMFSEWGKLLDTANAYERAHFFDRVEFEVDKSRQAFSFMGEKIMMVTKGEHVSKLVLVGISLMVTIGWVLSVPVLTSASTLEIAALSLYIFKFVGSLDVYAGAVSELRSALFEYTTLNDFVNQRSGVADVPNAVELTNKPNPEIEFKNVSFSYQGKVILDDISFKVQGGHILGLVGSSGCGKSTILRLLMRFYKQSSGTITVDGHDISKVTGSSLRRLFSVVTQDPQMFNSSIRDNIEYGRVGATEDAILNAATLAELSFDQAKDFTLDKVCGEKGAKISGGQRQRVALARAMLKNGTIYLLDEPTTGLDGLVAKQLQLTLDKLASHATTITVTHHLEDLRKADQILYLENGKITERGTYEELCGAGGVFYRQIQARSARDTDAPDSAVIA